MDLDRPYALVTSSLDGPVLQALATVEHLESGAEIHRRARTGSAHGVRKVLQRLVRQGLVEAFEHGHAAYYRLNRQHLAYESVLALSDLGPELARRLAPVLARRPGVRHASLFPLGSTGQVVTVLLVLDDVAELEDHLWEFTRQVAAERVGDWTGNGFQFRPVSVAELREHARRPEFEVREWGRNVLIAGAALTELAGSDLP